MPNAGTSNATQGFDEDFDVIVAGYGFSGSVAALEAARGGARTLLIEKSSVPGGISICSYGAIRSARDADRAFEYLHATNGGRTPDSVNHALARGMTQVEDYVRDLAEFAGAEVDASSQLIQGNEKSGGNYPFPGGETFYQTKIKSIPGFKARDSYPWANSRADSGPMLFKVLDENRRRFPFEIRMQTRAVRLLTAGSSNEVVGIIVRGPDGEKRLRARKGVVLACGGFENNPAMQEQFWEGRSVMPAAGQHNTGDGIVMAQGVGAALWHMWHAHGCYGFRHSDPTYPYAIRVKRLPDWFPTREHAAQVKMAWILLDKRGKRFMNEYQPYMQDTGHRALHQIDPVTQDYPRIPSLLLCDENGRKLYPLARPNSNDEGLYFEWSEDNLREVELGILKKADSLGALAAAFGIDPPALIASVERWNSQCQSGGDTDFGRPSGTMMPVVKPPFYAGSVWPVVSNTQGGPVRDGEQHVIDSFGAPIPHLYAVGDLGSAFGYLYLSGGNIAECFISGRVAGQNAAQGL
jgi:succinate dehydrogenase/fumarate reductase flavoprotein subunit